MRSTSTGNSSGMAGAVEHANYGLFFEDMLCFKKGLPLRGKNGGAQILTGNILTDSSAWQSSGRMREHY